MTNEISRERVLPQVGYLVSQFPSVHHTFILREIVALRQRGLQIDVVSVKACDRPAAALSDVERAEYTKTVYLTPVAVLCANLRCLVRWPARYVRAAVAAPFLGVSRGEPRWKGVVRLAQAATAADAFHRRGVTHFHAHFTSTVARLTARLSGLPWSITIHGPAEFDDVEGTRLAAKVAEAAFTVAISSYGASQLFRAVDPRLWPRVEVSYLGVDLERFSSPAPSRDLQRNPHAFVVACVARLAPVKGLQILLQSVAILRDRGVPVELRLVGDGPEREALTALVSALQLQGQVHLEGWRSEAEVRDTLDLADAFALTSFAEGIPVVLMEAMAMALPCVATWVNGIPELIEQSVSGLLVPAADAVATADALHRLYLEPGLRARLAVAARNRVASLFNLNVNVQVLADIFARRLASPNSRDTTVSGTARDA